MLNIAIDGLDEVQSKLSSYSSALVNAIGDRSDALAAALAEKVRSDKLAGGVLSSRTGALAASIFADVITNSDSVSAAVGSSGVPYAAIQEYGGKTAAHEIVPDKARALAFVGRRRNALRAPRRASGLHLTRAFLSALEPRRIRPGNRGAACRQRSARHGAKHEPRSRFQRPVLARLRRLSLGPLLTTLQTVERDARATASRPVPTRSRP